METVRYYQPELRRQILMYVQPAELFSHSEIHEYVKNRKEPDQYRTLLSLLFSESTDMGYRVRTKMPKYSKAEETIFLEYSGVGTNKGIRSNELPERYRSTGVYVIPAILRDMCWSIFRNDKIHVDIAEIKEFIAYIRNFPNYEGKHVLTMLYLYVENRDGLLSVALDSVRPYFEEIDFSFLLFESRGIFVQNNEGVYRTNISSVVYELFARLKSFLNGETEKEIDAVESITPGLKGLKCADEEHSPRSTSTDVDSTGFNFIEKLASININT